jgi:hypothetical protein
LERSDGVVVVGRNDKKELVFDIDLDLDLDLVEERQPA